MTYVQKVFILFYVSLLVIINMTKEKFSILINIKYNIKENYLARGEWFVRSLLVVKQRFLWRGWGHLGSFFIPPQPVLITDLQFGPMTFSPIFSLSSLIFMPGPSNFQNKPLICFGPYYFDYYMLYL